MTSMQTRSGRNINIAVTGQLGALGRVTPVIRMNLTFEVNDRAELRLDHLVVRLSCANELIGTGHLAGDIVYQSRQHTSSAMVDITTTHRMLEHVTDTLAHGSQVELTLHTYGLVSSRNSQAEAWEQETLPNNGVGHPHRLARTDWYEHVLSPVRQSDFTYLEIAVPHGDLAAPWRAAVNQLRRAEAAYAAGDDDAVFSRLRAALDSFPGAKKQIFAAVHDPAKRSKVDAMTKAYGDFLHLGRHVAEPGTPEAGNFPVAHLDAGHAIAHMKTLLSYASRLIPPRT